jgi:hypothetical protein
MCGFFLIVRREIVKQIFVLALCQRIGRKNILLIIIKPASIILAKFIYY